MASWGLGRRFISEGVCRDVELLENYTADIATAFAAQLTQRPSSARPALTVFACDAELAQPRIPDALFTSIARWWRAVACQLHGLRDNILRSDWATHARSKLVASALQFLLSVVDHAHPVALAT